MEYLLKVRVFLGGLLALTLFSCYFVYAENNSIAFDTVKPLVWEKDSSDPEPVAHRMWLQDGEAIIHEIRVYDYSSTERANESIQKLIDEFIPLTSPEGFKILGSITEIDHHEPYGVLETRVEVLRVEENNTGYDWYDVSVYQSLTPGANISSSWEWNWIQYTMNGAVGQGNVEITEYDQPPSHEPPKGIFTFLWQLLGFDLRNYIQWLRVSEPVLEGSDLSDSTHEVYRVKYEAPREYSHRDEPLDIRHHYVFKVGEGESPVFWHQTQVQYTQAEDFAQIPYITSPMADGYIKVR